MTKNWKDKKKNKKKPAKTFECNLIYLFPFGDVVVLKMFECKLDFYVLFRPREKANFL